MLPLHALSGSTLLACVLMVAVIAAKAKRTYCENCCESVDMFHQRTLSYSATLMIKRAFQVGMRYFSLRRLDFISFHSSQRSSRLQSHHIDDLIVLLFSLPFFCSSSFSPKQQNGLSMEWTPSSTLSGRSGLICWM